MDVRHRAHLAINLARYVEGDQINDHSHERGDAGKAINLWGIKSVRSSLTGEGDCVPLGACGYKPISSTDRVRALE